MGSKAGHATNRSRRNSRLVGFPVTWVIVRKMCSCACERMPTNNSLWASKTGNSGHTESVTCDRGRSGVFGQPVPGSVNREQSRLLPTSRLPVTNRNIFGSNAAQVCEGVVQLASSPACQAGARSSTVVCQASRCADQWQARAATQFCDFQLTTFPLQRLSVRCIT